MSGLTFEPYIPLALWLPMALLAIGVWVAYARNSRGRMQGRVRYGILLLMAIAVALPLIVLLNPTWIEPIPPPAGLPHLTLLVDDSSSMATADAESGQTRYAAALQHVEQLQSALGEQFEIHVRTVSAPTSDALLTELQHASPGNGVTDLAAALEQSLADRPQGQAVVLLSDGIHNAEGGLTQLRQSVAKAHAMAAPVYASTVGQQSGVRDLEVSVKAPQEMAFTGQTVPITVSVRQRGSLTDRVSLVLTMDGVEAQRQDVQVEPDASSEASFDVAQSAAGLYRYDIQVVAAPGEVTDLNNSAAFLLRVVSEPVRVLLLEGKPYWDAKFLTRTLSSDPSVDLTTWVRLAENRFLQRRIALPAQAATDSTNPATPGDTVARTDEWTTEQDLSKLWTGPDSLDSYQIVLLGRDAEVFLDDTRVVALKKWLAEKNGSLVCFRGAPATQVSQRMAELMPVRWAPTRESRFRVELTESGRAAQWLPDHDGQEVLNQLPSLATVAEAKQPKPLAVVLATSRGDAGDTTPVMTYQPVGNGRVVVIEGAGMWRWAFLPPEHRAFDDTYGMLWRSLVRWLVSNAGLLPSQTSALRADKVTFRTDETATATLLVRDTAAGGPPQVELSGGVLSAPQPFTPVAEGSWPGQYRVDFGKLPEGKYRATVQGTELNSSTAAAFDVRGNLTERLDVAARPDLLLMMSQESGGRILEGDLVQQLREHFDKYVAASRPQRSVKVTAWDRWWVLVTVCGLWAAAWGLRRRNGLI